MPGYIALPGHNSFFAGAPSITGGILRKSSSFFGNLNPVTLNALPKSLSLGKSRWQVAHDVPYCRENGDHGALTGSSTLRWTLRLLILTTASHQEPRTTMW